MIKNVLLFILGNICIGILIIAIYAVGYEYDKAHQIYPEMKRMSYDMSMQVWNELLNYYYLSAALLIL